MSSQPPVQPPNPCRVPSGWGGQEGIEELLKPLAAWFKAHPDGHPDALNFVFDLPVDRGAALVAAWTGKVGLHAYLVPFGSTRNGSLYALWLVENRTAKEAPVVLLDSEGVAYSYVVANTYPEFLALLSAGLEDFDDPESVLPDSPELLAFREWVLTQGFKKIPDFAEVNAITTEAFEEAPDFLSWLESSL